MCGIIGCIGYNVRKNLINGLESMEYRGYDSCGIAYIVDGKFNLEKSLSSPKKIKSKNIFNIGIGHTRWATHGKVSLENAHPILSNDNKIAIVHNGIVENYLEIKEKYINSITLKGQTDTEVLVNLISYFYQNNSIEEAIQKSNEIIKGSYAFLILVLDKPDTIYYACNNMPLIIGKDDDNLLIASDILAFPEKYNSFVFLSEKKFGVLNKKEKLDLEFIQVKRDNYKNKTNYDTHMISEIHEINYVIDNINSYLKEKNTLETIKIINLAKSICFIGCGSSYNANCIGSYLINKKRKIECVSILASEFIYQYNREYDLYILTSQSGETADVLKAINVIPEGKTTISICNVSTSSLVRKTQYNLKMCSGPEIAVASTKAFFSTIYLLYFCINYDELDENSKKIKSSVSKVIDNEKFIKTFSSKFIHNGNFIFLGRGINYLINCENTLKIKEITYTFVENYYGGELKHGPLALCTSDICAFVINNSENTNSIMNSNISEVKSRGTKCYVFSSFPSKNNIFTFELSEDLSIFECCVFFQLFAYYLSILRGYNPDRPRNLAKSVTVE